MSKTQKIIKFINSTPVFLIFLLFFIIVLFVVLSPKVSSLLFPLKRQAILNQFINKTKTEGSIDPRGYWEFREFYSPGYFIFTKTGIEKSLSENLAQKIGFKYDKKGIDLTYLFFSSPKLNSLDMLTRQSSLSKLIDQKQFQKKNIIFMNKNSLIYQKDSKTIEIFFLFSNSALQNTNGFFDYQERDKKLTTGENWFNVTYLRTD